MSIRRDPIYISSEVHRWLRLLARADGTRPESYSATGYSPASVITADEIADQILRQAIREQHPQLADLQKQIAKLEDATVEQLRVDTCQNNAKSKSNAQP